MPHTCPDCGAAYPDGSTCPDAFDRLLYLEFTDPAYGAVHFLTVACYMIQHRLYSDPALAWIQRQLRDYFAGVPVEEIRRRAGEQAEPAQRGWKVARQPEEPPLPRILWSRTIADACAQSADARSYCQAVTAWACAVLDEMGPLLPANRR